MPKMLRPSATLVASLLSSPRTVRLVSPVVTRLSPSAEACTGATGHGFGRSGVPTSKTAFRMVTQAPAVKACPAGASGWAGDPAFDTCGSRKLPVAPMPRFTLSCRLCSKIKGNTEEFSRSGCRFGLSVKRLPTTSVHHVAELFGTELAMDIPFRVEHVGFGLAHVPHQTLHPGGTEGAETADSPVIGVGVVRIQANSEIREDDRSPEVIGVDTAKIRNDNISHVAAWRETFPK